MSRIRRQFWDQIPSWIQNIPEVQKDWSPMLQSLDGHSGMVRAVAFTPDGKLLASASCDGTARLWDPSTGASRGILEGHSYNVAAAFSPDVLLLATGYDDGTIKLWETSTGASRVTLEGHDSFVWAVAFSPNGQLLASASNDGTVRLWGVLTRATHCTPSCHRSVSALAFSPDGQLLASASDDGMVKLWDPSTGVACGALQGDSCDLIAVAFSPVSQLLACLSSNSKVTLWDPSTGASHNIRTNDDDFDCVNALVFSLDGLLLASASLDNRIKLWDPSTGAARGTLEGHSDSILAMAFSPDGQLLASASYDNTVRLWDIKTKKTIEKLDTKTPIEELSFLSNCSYLSTRQGILELKRLTNCKSRSQSNSRLFPLRVSGNWVKVGEENILWLPPTYQPRSLSVRDNILAMGLGSDEVVFVEFDPATIPLGESFVPDSQQGV
jgi:WD40 repeat protein